MVNNPGKVVKIVNGTQKNAFQKFDEFAKNFWEITPANR